MNITALAWAILLLPVLGFLLCAFAGSSIERALGRRVLGVVAVVPIFLAFLAALAVTFRIPAMATHAMVAPGLPWIDIFGLTAPFELVVDPLSMTMSLIVTGVGALIFLYSTGYMGEDREYSRFFTYMNLFAASMLLLVLGNNLPLFFIGWEGVGLCSYLLIGFWYEDLANAKAANKAFIVNRIGDWGLMLGIFLLFVLVTGTKVAPPDVRVLSYDAMARPLMFALVKHHSLATAAALLLFVGAAGKSAQFPLYLWLPDAMAGPTPVSALIHAATMVTSGVVLVNRMQVVFAASPEASAVVCAIGAFTALYAAIIAFGQTDIKRVLAYSTVSQLGYMFIGCGAGGYWTGIFHVTTHAFFKALLFLGAGAVIHAMAHNQDMRNYGNLRKYLPLTFVTMAIAWLAISAVPPLAGFWSKDELLGVALSNHMASLGGQNVSFAAGCFGLLAAILTAAYMTRMMWLTFMGPQERWRTQPEEAMSTGSEAHAMAAEASSGENADASHEAHGLNPQHTPREVGPSMWIPLVILAVLSLIGGAFKLPLEHWLADGPAAPLLALSEAPQFPLWQISTLFAVLGIAAGVYSYRKGLPANQGIDESKWSPTRLWIRRQFGFDDAMTSATVEGGAEVGALLSRGFDTGLLDGIVNGLAGLAAWVGRVFSVAQRGLVRGYALLMLVGGLVIVGYMLWGGSR